jgi:hypothetical protein
MASLAACSGVDDLMIIPDRDPALLGALGDIPVDPPSHLRTFLVADIPGYTRPVHPDEYIAVLSERVQALARAGSGA